MTHAKATYPLRLPRSVKAEIERRAKADGISVNQFVATAVAEKLAATGTVELFAEQRPWRFSRRSIDSIPQQRDKV